MKHEKLRRRQQGPTVYGILTIILVFVVLQLWLLTATMNAFLGGDGNILWPAATASFICFGLNLGLLRYLLRLERRE